VITDYNFSDLEKGKNILKKVDTRFISAQCKTEEKVYND